MVYFLQIIVQKIYHTVIVRIAVSFPEFALPSLDCEGKVFSFLPRLNHYSALFLSLLFSPFSLDFATFIISTLPAGENQ
jgi:hypothetical protein